MSHEHHHISAGEIGFFALLAAILTLPAPLLLRAAKRLAILVGIFALIVVGLLVSFNLARPLCSLGPEITAPTSNDPQLCKENAEKRSAETKAALAKLDADWERETRDRPR